MKLKFILLLFSGIIFLLSPVVESAGEHTGWMVVSRRTSGQSDLWAMAAGGRPSAWQRLTNTPTDERWPAWHPEGHTLAYAARRHQNWDIYTLDLRTGKEERLTSNAHFDGWPAWSPDGKRLAFASSREGNLDLFLFDLRTKKETNLTPELLSQEFEPQWIDNEQLIFVSTQNYLSHDIFRLRVEAARIIPITKTAQRSERQPIPLADKGEFLVLTKEGSRRDIAWQPLSPSSKEISPLFSWNGSAFSFALSPDHKTVVWLEEHLSGDMLYQRRLDGGEVRLISGPTAHLNDLAWGMPQRRWLQKLLEPPAKEPPAKATELFASQLVEINDLQTIKPSLNKHALPVFQAIRARILTELGNDFLGTVSEAARPIGFNSSQSDYLSWHKAGRAIDTLLGLGWHGDYELMELVREESHGNIYWRMWLRCPVQDGSCGEPLTEAPWNFSPEAGWGAEEGLGGRPKLFQSGYYVDFTRIAEDEGWERIASYQLAEFNWRTNYVALEFWHYEYTTGLHWYDAIRELYPPDVLNKWFNWPELVKQDIPRWRLRIKGIPLPPEIRHAPAEIVMP
jgi:TolB protein